MDSNPFQSPNVGSHFAESKNSIASNDVVDQVEREWSLAIVVVSATLIVIAPLILILAVLIWAHADRGSGSVLLHAWLARAGCAIAATCSCGNVVSAMLLRRRDSSTRNTAIDLIRIAMAVIAMLFWIIASIGLLNTTESMLIMYG